MSFSFASCISCALVLCILYICLEGFMKWQARIEEYTSFLILGSVHVTKNILSSDTFLGNKLSVTYCKSLELLDDACKLFDELSERTIPAYASLISSFCRSEKWVNLFVVFEMMFNDRMLPDRFLLPTIYKACSVMRVGKCGEMVHGYAIRRGLDKDVVVGNALIDMYTYYGSLNVFNTMKTKDVVSWTVLIVAYMLQDGVGWCGSRFDLSECTCLWLCHEWENKKGMRPEVKS